MTKEIERIKNVYAERKTSSEVDYNPLLPENYYLLNSREKLLVKLINKYYGPYIGNLNILDVGFGGGFDLLTFIKYGADIDGLFGVEILEERYNRVKEIIPRVNLLLTNDFSLPFEDKSIDIINQSTVFSSILDKNCRTQLAFEMYRVLKPGGRIFSYDIRYPNPWNQNVIMMDKKEIKDLFPSATASFYPVTLNPVIVRKIAQFSVLLCELLEFSFLCSHYYSVLEKK